MVEELKAAIASVRDAYAKTDTRESSEAYDLAYSRAFDLLRDHGQALLEAVDDAERYRWLRDSSQDQVEVFFATEANPSGWGDWNSWDDKGKAIDIARTKASAGGGA